MDYMDAEAMEAMLKVEGDVLAITCENQVIRLYSSCLLMGTLAFGLGSVFLKS